MRTNLGHSGALALGTLALVGALVSGCGAGEQQKQDAARAEKWAAIELSRDALTDLRRQHDELASQVAALEEGGEPAADSPPLEELVTQASAIEERIVKDADMLMSEVVTYINEAEVEVGAETPADVLNAIRVKSAEDLEIALDYVAKGGDYSKAQSIIESSLRIDPDNPLLQEKLAWVKEWRYVTEERFAQVKNDMTQAQVKELLGPTNASNTREFDGQRVGWFYPKDPEIHGARTAAGVYFQKKSDRWLVYQSNWEAVKGDATPN
jgi:hypothetical protein